MKSTSIIRYSRTLRAAMLGATALGATLAATPTLAQTSDDASVDSNTIIVTAQRRNEALEDVPMSVSVVTQETLASAGINTLRDLQNVTSGFQLNQSGSIPQPAIRGVSSTTAGSYENNVALFVDGLYQTTSAVLNADLPNVQGIQILKGPQGTLYGRNATGGAILLDTIDPGNELEGSIEATYGRFNDRRVRGYVATPLGEKVGLSVAGTFRQTDGYYKRASRVTPGEFDGTVFGLRQESLRAKLKFDLDVLRVTVGYNYLRSRDPRGVFFTPIENVPAWPAGSGPDTRPRGLGEAAGDLFTLDLKQHEGYGKIEIDTGIGTLRSITGYTIAKTATTYDSGGNYRPDIYIDSVVRDRTWQQSLDLNIDTIDNVNLILGGNYYNIKTDYLPGRGNVVYLGPANYLPYTFANPQTSAAPLSDYRIFQGTDYKRTKEAWAVFADLTFNITEQLSITAGGRYSKETQNVAAERRNWCANTDTVALRGGQAAQGCNTGTIGQLLTGRGTPGSGIPYDFTTSAKRSNYSKFTPRATIRFEIAPRTNIYASYSKGFRGGEWNSTPPNDTPQTSWFDAKQETIDAYEIGLKSGGGRFRFDLAGFYYDYRNLQVSNTVFVGLATVVTLQNAPKAKIYGAEANFEFDLIDNLTIRGGGTWLHGRYGNGFVYTGTGVNPALPAITVSADPLKNVTNVANVFQDLSGLQMARAPDFSGYIGADYNIPNGEGGLRLAANLKYTTSYVVTDPSVWGGETAAAYNARRSLNPAALPNNEALLAGTAYVGRASEQRARQGAYALVNASITWTDPTGRQYIRVWGNNITDIKYRTHYRPSSATAGTYIPMGEPATYGGTIGYKF